MNNLDFVLDGETHTAIVEKSQTGFVVKSGEEYYAYTSQAALMSLGRFALKSFDGTTIATNGPLELSYYSDIARIIVALSFRHFTSTGAPPLLLNLI